MTWRPDRFDQWRLDRWVSRSFRVMEPGPMTYYSTRAPAADVMTQLELEQLVWDGKHRDCVLFMEDGKVTECVTCGSVRPRKGEA